MKYFLCLGLSVFFVAARAQKQDTVRWFVGHWVDKKTFRIDSTLSGKGGGGGTITATPGSGLRFNSPAEKAFEDNINETITNVDKAEQDIAATGKQTEGMYQFGLTDETLKELEKVKEDFKALGKVEEKAPPPAKSATALQLEKTCAALAPEYHRIIDFYKAHKEKKTLISICRRHR